MKWTNKHTWIVVVAVIFLSLALSFSGNYGQSWTTGSSMMGAFGQYTGEISSSATADSIASPGVMMRGFELAPEESIIVDGSGAQKNTGEFVIKTGEITMKVDDANLAAAQLTELATKYQGAVLVRSLSKQFDGRLSGYVTLQMAEEHFDTAFTEIKTLATEVTSENVSSEDVTEQVYDLEARLSNAQAEEQSYLAVLAQAKDVEDILAVQQYLSQVRQTIEQLEAQKEYLASQTSYSTITVYLSEEESITIGGQEFRPGQAVVDAAQTVVRVFQNLVIGVIKAVIIGGAFLIPALILFFLGRALYRKFQK